MLKNKGWSVAQWWGIFFSVLKIPRSSPGTRDGGVRWKVIVYNNVDALLKKLSNSM